MVKWQCRENTIKWYGVKHHRSGLNGQVCLTVRLEVRHTVVSQSMLAASNYFPSGLRPQDVALSEPDRLEDKQNKECVIKTIKHQPISSVK